MNIARLILTDLIALAALLLWAVNDYYVWAASTGMLYISALTVFLVGHFSRAFVLINRYGRRNLNATGVIIGGVLLVSLAVADIVNLGSRDEMADTVVRLGFVTLFLIVLIQGVFALVQAVRQSASK